MIDPALWESTPFNNLTALQDYFGMEDQFHRALADIVQRQLGKTYHTYPLGDGGGQPWLSAHQRELVAASAALGIPGPPDLSSFDLRKAEEWTSYHFLNGQFHRTLRLAAGIV